jgi:hypothetical protein
VLAAGPAQRLTVTFTPTDTANYNVASAAVPITVISAAVASPVKIGTTIGGTFSDATGHSGQSHLVFAPNANVWWLFTLSSAHDALGDRTVQSYVSSGPDLATATWSAKAVSPTLGNANSATSSVLAGGRSLGVAVRSISGVDYAHVFVSAAFDGQTSSNGHSRATLGATTISWGAWNNPGSPNTASEWQGPLNSGNPPSAAATHTSWGNSIGISTGGFIHHFSVTLDQEVDCAVGRSTNADVSASWTNGFGTNTSPTGLAGTSPPWTVAVIDKTMTNECKAMSFAPLASDVMLAVYSNGAVVQPNLTNLRYQKSGASGTWTNISASTGGGSGNVFSSTATISQNDWALVPVNTTTIHAYRRKATGTGIDAATYNVAGNSFAASAVQPPAFGTGQAFKAGGGLFGATDGTNVWLFVINTDTANSILYTQWNGTSWTAWATVPGTGVGSQTRNYITGNPTIGSGQAGLAWTQTNGSNFDVYTTSFRTATAAPPATVSITAPANLSTVAATVNVTANATPGGGTIAGVQFLLDGANLGAEDTVSPYSVSWDTTAVTNGTHFLTAVARDTNGGTGTATTVSVTVANDLTAPTVAMTAPANGSSVSGASVSVAAEALDDIGVVGVQFLLDGANLGAEDTVAPYIISWNASTASAGTHTLSARARWLRTPDHVGHGQRHGLERDAVDHVAVAGEHRLRHGTRRDAAERDDERARHVRVYAGGGNRAGGRRRTDAVDHVHADRSDQLHDRDRDEDDHRHQGDAVNHVAGAGEHRLRHGARRRAAERDDERAGHVRLHARSGNRAGGRRRAEPLGDVHADRRRQLHDCDRERLAHRAEGVSGAHLADARQHRLRHRAGCVAAERDRRRRRHLRLHARRRRGARCRVADAVGDLHADERELLERDDHGHAPGHAGAAGAGAHRRALHLRHGCASGHRDRDRCRRCVGCRRVRLYLHAGRRRGARERGQLRRDGDVHQQRPELLGWQRDSHRDY